MIELEPGLFTNLGGAISRTASLAGGEVRGLPGGVVVGGLQGVGAFSSAVADAQKEARLGRLTVALERIRQLEKLALCRLRHPSFGIREQDLL